MLALLSILSLQASLQQIVIGEWEIFNQSSAGVRDEKELSLYGIEIIQNNQTGQIIGTLWHNDMKYYSEVKEVDDYLIDTIKFDFDDSSIKVSSFKYYPGKTFDISVEESNGNYIINGVIEGEEISILFKDDTNAELMFGEKQLDLVKYSIPKASELPKTFKQMMATTWWEELLTYKYLPIFLIGTVLLIVEFTIITLRCCLKSSKNEEEKKSGSEKGEAKAEEEEEEKENHDHSNDNDNVDEGIVHRKVEEVAEDVH